MAVIVKGEITITEVRSLEIYGVLTKEKMAGMGMQFSLQVPRRMINKTSHCYQV